MGFVQQSSSWGKVRACDDFLLEVQPQNGQPFHAELLVPVKGESLRLAQPGTVIWVKYFPRNPAPDLLQVGNDICEISVFRRT